MTTYRIRINKETTPSGTLVSPAVLDLKGVTTDVEANLVAAVKALSAPPAPAPAPAPSPSPAPATKARFFSAQSLWNKPLADSEPLASNSTQIIAALKTVKGDNTQLQTSWGNGWGIPVYYAKESDPRVNVVNPDGWKMESIPLPADAQGASGSDGYLVIVAPFENRIYNFFGARRTAGQNDLKIVGLGIFRLDGPGWWDPGAGPGGPWVGNSSNACYAGGIVFPDELAAGEIPHAIFLANDQGLQPPSPVLPAKTADGWGTNPSGVVPLGTRLRIRPDVNIDALPGLGRDTKTIARAMQKYGAVFCDRTSGIAMRFQENSKPVNGFDQAGLTGGLFNYCVVLKPVASYEYDHPGLFNNQPHR